MVLADHQAELPRAGASRLEVGVDAGQEHVSCTHAGDIGGYMPRCPEETSPAHGGAYWGNFPLMAKPDPLRDNIRSFLARTGMSERELSTASGLNEKAVSQILAGKSQSPRGKSLQGLSDVMGMSVSELLGGVTQSAGDVGRRAEAQLDPPRSPLHSHDAASAIPEIDVLAGAGLGGEALVEAFTDAEGNQISQDVVKAQWGLPASYTANVLGLRAKQARIIEVRGDSMAPTLLTGDRVMVDTGDRVPSPDGLFALFDGIGVVVKRLQRVPNTDPPAFQIISDNPHHIPYQRVLDEIHLIGRVVWLARKI